MLPFYNPIYNVMLNPQPLPPLNAFSRVALNPQPLPPVAQCFIIAVL